MDYKLGIVIVVENNGEKTTNNFEDEYLEITRSSNLWIKNLSGRESELFESIKIWNQMDEKNNTKSN